MSMYAMVLRMSFIAFGALVWTSWVAAAPMTITFEGLGEFEYVNNYYSGGFGGSGSGPGPNFGVTFSPGSTYTSIDSDNGGTGDFAGEPSPNTAVSFQQDAAWMNVPAGFSGRLSFYYTNPNGDNTIRLYSGLTGGGSLIASLFLPRTPYGAYEAGDPTGRHNPFMFASVTFTGMARSVNFIELAHRAYMDDITLGAPVPVPGAVVLMLSGLVVLVGIRRR